MSDTPKLSAEELAEIRVEAYVTDVEYIAYVKVIKLLDHTTALTKERDEAYGYLSRLFVALAPQCTPLPNLLGVCTQIDNWSVGAKDKEAELARIRGRLTVEQLSNVVFQSPNFDSDPDSDAIATAIISHITKE
jgi:hypothetical protein